MAQNEGHSTVGDARIDGAPRYTPSPAWVLDFARRWSASKSETAIKALAWNINGAFAEWRAEPPSEDAPTRPAQT